MLCYIIKLQFGALVDLPMVALRRPNELSSTNIRFPCATLVVIVALAIICGENLQIVINLMFEKMQSHLDSEAWCQCHQGRLSSLWKLL